MNKFKVVLIILLILVALVSIKYIFFVALFTLKMAGFIGLAFLIGYLVGRFSKSKNS